MTIACGGTGLHTKRKEQGNLAEFEKVKRQARNGGNAVVQVCTTCCIFPLIDIFCLLHVHFGLPFVYFLVVASILLTSASNSDSINNPFNAIICSLPILLFQITPQIKKLLP